MIELRPTPQQERWAAAARRLRVADHTWIAPRIGSWKIPSAIARCAFFVLGAVVGGLTVAVFEFLYQLGAMLVAGVIMFGAAEWLIVRKHLYHAGVEEALWCGGLAAVAVHFFPTSSEVGLSAAIALVFMFAGIRLLNPLFATMAAVVASVAIDLAGGRRQLGEPDVAVTASLFCYGVGVAALLLARRRYSRPSHDQMLSWLMIVMPLCGFLWLATQHQVGIRVGTGLASAVFAATTLITGIRRRTHAPLIACFASVGCVAYQLRDLTALPLELKLILWGSAALLLAWCLDRYLRTPRHGITSRQLDEGSNTLDLAQIVGAGALSPAAAHQPDSTFKGGGGTFGGGGADGSY